MGLAEALDQAVQHRETERAEAEHQRRLSQVNRRANICDRAVLSLCVAMGVVRPPSLDPVVLEVTSIDSIQPKPYVAITVDGITVAVELWPTAGAEHQENRPYLIHECETCGAWMAVPVSLESAGDWADAHMARRHHDAVQCDEPF